VRDGNVAPESRPAADASGESRPPAPAEGARNPELPFSSEPRHAEPPRGPAPVASTPESSPPREKFVVWSSGPADSTPHGPGRDD
jgi:hypothetical protein